MTGLRIASSLISLVSFNTSFVAATRAAFREALLVRLARWGADPVAGFFACRANIPRVRIITRAGDRLIRFDMVGLPLL